MKERGASNAKVESLILSGGSMSVCRLVCALSPKQGFLGSSPSSGAINSVRGVIGNISACHVEVWGSNPPHAAN